MKLPLRDSAFELYPLSRARLTTRLKCIKMRFSPRSTHSLLIKAKRGLHSLSRRQGALILMVAVYIATLCHSASAQKKIRGDASVSVNGSIAVPAVFALTTQRTVQAAKKEFPSHWGSPPRMQTRDLRSLPGGYGMGSGTLARWIQENISRDEIRAQVISGQYSGNADGDGSISIAGELKQWHRVTLTLDGPFAHELQRNPNPFTDYRLEVVFRHSDGHQMLVPGFFAADGNAANTSAESGTKWRVHFAPDAPGDWTYQVYFYSGTDVALTSEVASKRDAKPHPLLHGKRGQFAIIESDKQGRDLRAHGRLEYVGERYLRFAGSGKPFLKFGADAPETLLGYEDFDGTIAMKPQKVPLKSWEPHLRDWETGDPTWRNGRGRGLIGAINYLSGKGCNAFSFLTYNAGGDGDNVWPFVLRDDKLHYDCSKLDQWQMVFDHGTAKGMYLHFKMQETENDDERHRGQSTGVPEALDGGSLGKERMLYCRELVARFGHALALNWNLGEENTQTTTEQVQMMRYIEHLDPYDHPIVLHTYPEQQEKIYRPLLGQQSPLAGLSLQNSSISDTHRQTCFWVKETAASGRPLVVAFDESGSAAHGQCPDLGYRGFDGSDRNGKKVYTEHDVRRKTLWGTLMAGGAGCEYYFGYQFVQNDLVCEDWRSRDRSWDYGRIALGFFEKQEIPFPEMREYDALIGNPEHGNNGYCFAKPGTIYLLYLPQGELDGLDLSSDSRRYSVRWFDPKKGGELQMGSISEVEGGGTIRVGNAPNEVNQDWLVILRAK